MMSKSYWILLVWTCVAGCFAQVETPSTVSLLQNDLGSEGPQQPLKASLTLATDLPRSLEEAGMQQADKGAEETPLWGKQASIRRRRRRRRTDQELGDLLARVDRVQKAKRKEVDQKIGRCHTSTWMDWGPCAETGTRSRNRTIEVQPQNGLECPPLVQTVFCPLDCTVGPWKDKEGCTAGCGGGTKKVERQMLKPSLNGGSACPALKAEVPCNNHPCAEDCQVSSWFREGFCVTPMNTCVQGEMKLRRKIVVPAYFGGKACPPLAKAIPCTMPECIDEFKHQVKMLKNHSGDGTMLDEAYKASKNLLSMATKSATTGDFDWSPGLYKGLQSLKTESVDAVERVAGGASTSLFATDTDACLAEAKTYKECKANLAAVLRNETCGTYFSAWSSCVQKCKQFNCAYLRPYTSAYKASLYKPVAMTVAGAFGFVASSPRYVSEMNDIQLELKPHEGRELPPDEFRESLMSHPELATLDVIDLTYPDGAVSRVADLPKIYAVAGIESPNEAGVFVLHPVKYSQKSCERVDMFSDGQKSTVCQRKQMSSEYSLTYISNIRNYTDMLTLQQKCKQHSDQWDTNFCHRRLIHKTANMVPCGDKTGYCYAHNYFQGCVHGQDPALCKCIQTLLHKNRYCHLAERAKRLSLIHSAPALKGTPIVAASSVLAAAKIKNNRYAFITRESDMEIHRVDLDGPCGATRKTCDSMSLANDAVPPIQCYDVKKPGWSTVISANRKYPISCSGAKSEEDRCSFCYTEQQAESTIEYDFGCFPKDRRCGCEPTYATSAAVWRGHDRVTAVAVQTIGEVALFVATNGPSGSTLWRVTGVLSPTALQCLGKHSCSSAVATALIPSSHLLYVSAIHISSPDGNVTQASFYDEGKGKVHEVSSTYYSDKTFWNASIFEPVDEAGRQKTCIDINPHCHAKVWKQDTFWDRSENKCFAEQKAMDDECCATCSKMRKWHERQWQDEHCTVLTWSKYSKCKQGTQERHRTVIIDSNVTTGHTCPARHDSRRCMPLDFKLEVTNVVGAAGIHKASGLKGKLYVLSKGTHELQTMAAKTSVVCPSVMHSPQITGTFDKWRTPIDEPIVGEEGQVLLADDSAKWRVRPYKKRADLGALGIISKAVLCFQEVHFDAIRKITRLGHENCCIRMHSKKGPLYVGTFKPDHKAGFSLDMNSVVAIQTALKTL